MTMAKRDAQEIPDRKIIKSWSIKPKEKLSCPVVHCDETYYGIKDDKWVLMWEESDPELWQSSMIKLRKPAQKIHVCRRLQHEPVLIYQDNEAVPFSSTKLGKEKKEKLSKTTERLLWCGTHMVSDGNVWFSKVLGSQDCTKVSLVMHLFKKSKQLMYGIKAPEDSKVLHWSLVDEDDESAFFISLWSNGGLYKTEIPAISKAESEQEVSTELMFNVFNGPLPASEVSCTHVSHVALSFVCVADSGCREESQKGSLCLWDTKFGTLHSQKSLSDCVKTSTASSVSPGILHLQSTSSYVIVASNSCVYVCSYTAEKSTLKSSLGKLQQSDKCTNNTKPQFLVTPKLIEPHQSVQEWKNEVSKEDETEDEMLCRLLDLKKTKTAKKLATELRKYFQKSSSKGSCTGQPTVSQYFVTSVFEQCLKDKDLWSRETGKLILKTQVLPQRCFSQFFSLVLENSDIVLLQDCFNNLKGIPESTLVDCLKFVLRSDDDVFPTFMSTELWTQSNTPCSLSRAKYLSLVLSHPINDAFLQTSLRKLQFEDTLLFMKFLLHVIKSWSIPLRDLLQIEGSMHTLTYLQILDWAALIINAHFTQLILIPEAQTLLVNLHKVIAEQITTYEELGELGGHLSHFTQNEPLPRKDHLGAYSIESLEL